MSTYTVSSKPTRPGDDDPAVGWTQHYRGPSAERAAQIALTVARQHAGQRRVVVLRDGVEYEHVRGMSLQEFMATISGPPPAAADPIDLTILTENCTDAGEQWALDTYNETEATGSPS